MRRHYWDISFVFSLMCSLLINSGMIGLVALHERNAAMADASAWHTATIRPPPPAPNPEAQPPQPKIEFDNRDAFGENGGVGEALNSSPGDKPLQARMGPQEQSFLGRTPPPSAGGGGGTGSPAMIGAASPSANAAPRVKVPPPPLKPVPKQPPQPKTDEKSEQAQKSPPEPQAKDTSSNKGEEPEVSGNQVAHHAVPPPPPPPPEQPPQVADNQNSAAQQPAENSPSHNGSPAPPGAPGPPNESAEQAPPSDTESDPFSRSNSFVFANGRVLARNGRWVKSVRPHISEAGLIDADLMGEPTCTFLATVDEQGNVVRVVRYKSSGSDNIDLPCEEALNEWKIEPSKDAAGHPVRDVVSVTFGLEH